MKRFMGMMPSSCIEIRKDFKDKDGKKVHIDAGPEGWTVIYADGSTQYDDVVATSEDNYKAAYKIASKNLNLIEIDPCTRELLVNVN